jgi:Fe-S cluster assembly protein SufD
VNVVAAAPASPGLFESLPAAPAGSSDEPSWLAARRSSARELLRARGLPDNRDEDWRFTPLRRFNGTSYARAPVLDAAGPSPSQLAAHALLANGRGAVHSALDGVALSSLRDTLRARPDVIEAYLGSLTEGASGFPAANTAGFEDGVLVLVKRGTRVSAPLVLDVIGAAHGTPSLVQPRVLVVLEPSSELVLVERQELRAGAAQLCNLVVEVFLEEGAVLEHVRIQHGAEGQSALARVMVRQARDSRYSSRNFTFGGHVTRTDSVIQFAGPGASASLDGLYLGERDEHVEHHVVVDHATSHCESTQKYKGLLNDRAHGVFDGAIFVRRGTKGTSADQENRNILLSAEAVAHTKPRLEIDVDDVRCSHGATVGRLDPAQLFYLRSRGIERDQAQSLLSLAFAKEMIDRVPEARVRSDLLGSLLARLPDSAALGDVS